MKMKNLLLTSIAILGLTLITSAQVPSYVPTNGLVGWWPFNGNANDESGNGNNLTNNGAQLTADRFGNTNQSFLFNGTTDYLSRNIFNGLTDCSMSFWVNMVNYPQNSNGSEFISNGNGNSNGFGIKYAYGVGASNIITLITYGNNYNVTNSNFNPSLNNWYHIVVNKVSNSYSIFINGQLNSNGNGITNSSIGFFTIGAVKNSSTNIYNFFNGKIDDIGIWNRALTQAEITDLFTSSSVGISEVSQSNLFSVYPNPANSQINVKADTNLLGSIYTVYDNTGKVVLSGKINTENTVIELGNLSGGVYLFSVGENMKQTFKVIKE
jgi:hypothetical protein